MAKNDEQAERPTRERRHAPPQPLSPPPPPPIAEEEEDEGASEPAPAASAPEPDPGPVSEGLTTENCVSYLRQVQARVVFFRRNDGTERVKVSHDTFSYEEATLETATALLKARIERFASRNLPGARRRR